MALKTPSNEREMKALQERLKKRSEADLRVTYRNLVGEEAPKDMQRPDLLKATIAKVELLAKGEVKTAPERSLTEPRKAPRRSGEPRFTIKQHVVQLLTEKPDLSAEAMIQKVKEKFPDSAFKATHVAWYRNKFKSGDLR